MIDTRLILFIVVVMFALTGCGFHSDPTISNYEPTDSERFLLSTTGVENYFIYDFDLGDIQRRFKVEFWIDLYDKGKKVDEIHRAFDTSVTKGKIAFFNEQTGNNKLEKYQIGYPNVSATATLKSVTTLSEKLAAGSEDSWNSEAKIKFNQPIVLAYQAFPTDSQTGPVSLELIKDKELPMGAIFKDKSLLEKLKQKYVVIIYKCQFDIK